MKIKNRFLAFSVLFVSLTLVFGCAGPSSDVLPDELLNENIERVGFDIDDTLLFSSPAFQEGFQSDAEPFSAEFWSLINSLDSEVSCIKPKVYDIVKTYQAHGVEVYAITARQPYNGEHLKEYMEKAFGIPKDQTFFEPDSKTPRIEELELDLYFGDSDSDITDAHDAGIPGIRIERHEESSYHEKYNPGDYDELIIETTTGHDCDFKPYE